MKITAKQEKTREEEYKEVFLYAGKEIPVFTCVKDPSGGLTVIRIIGAKLEALYVPWYVKKDFFFALLNT